MKITLTEKYYFGYWQGWTIRIDGKKYPILPGYVYTARSAVQALEDCFRDRCDGGQCTALTTAKEQK